MKIVFYLLLFIFVGLFIKGYLGSFNYYQENPDRLVGTKCIREDKNSCEEVDVEWDKFGSTSRKICECLETKFVRNNIYFESIKEGFLSLGLPIFIFIIIAIFYLGRNV